MASIAAVSAARRIASRSSSVLARLRRRHRRVEQLDSEPGHTVVVVAGAERRAKLAEVLRGRDGKGEPVARVGALGEKPSGCAAHSCRVRERGGVPDPAERLCVKPRARALDVIEGRGWRASKRNEPRFEVCELCEQGLSFDVGCVGRRGATPETALDPAQILGLVESETKQPAIPVAECNAFDLPPWIDPWRAPSSRGTSVGSFGCGSRRRFMLTPEPHAGALTDELDPADQ
jgi:hypothetical protein